MNASLASDWYFKFEPLNMLRVLDLTVASNCKRLSEDMPAGIVDVVLLRYLALSSNWLVNSIPVRKNRNLQTLIVCKDINGSCELPDGIWDLPKLRHLELYNELSIYSPEVVQVNLQTLYWLQSYQCTEQVFFMIPNVRELGIIAQGNGCNNCFLDNLNLLDHLEKIKVRGTDCVIQLSRDADIFPKNLSKITFMKTHMPWTTMRIISKLPNLVVLKLKNHACVGPEWKLTEGDEFRKLKHLLVSFTQLEEWNADEVECPFPVLERLVLRNCFELKEMPSWINNMNTSLKSIQLEHCYASLVNSARMIEKELCEEYGVEIKIVEFHTQSDVQTTGEIKHPNYWIKARDFCISWVNESEYWKFTCDSGHEVAKLLNVRWLDIIGMVNTKCLHEMTWYSAYLVFKLVQAAMNLDTALVSVRYIRDKIDENLQCQVFLTKTGSSDRFSHCRDDGWLEIKLGDFYVSSGNEGEVEMRLWNTEDMRYKTGLIVRGIDVRSN